MSKRNAEQLISAVRRLPPSSPRVVGDFAAKIFDVADEAGQIEDADVIEIVTNWPGGCEEGANQFLENQGIEIPTKNDVTFAKVATFVRDGSAGDEQQRWLYGAIEGNANTDIFPNGGARNGNGTMDQSFGAGGRRDMYVFTNVSVNVEALNSRAVSSELKLDINGEPWLLVTTNQAWNGNGISPWVVAIKLS